MTSIRNLAKVWELQLHPRQDPAALVRLRARHLGSAAPLARIAFRADRRMCDDGASNLQATLSSKLRDGFLCDVEPVSRVCGTITEPSALAPWASFSYKLFRSATATDVIKSLLEGTVPGTTASYATILSAIASPQSDMSQRHYCSWAASCATY